MTGEQSQCNTCANYCERKEEPATPQEMMAGFVLYVAPCVLVMIYVMPFVISQTSLSYLASIIFAIVLCYYLMKWLRPFRPYRQNTTGE